MSSDMHGSDTPFGWLSSEQLDRLLRQFLDEHPLPTVPDELYARRLQHCQSCNNLHFGNTCKFTGCLVQIRAKLAGESCANADDPKW